MDVAPGGASAPPTKSSSQESAATVCSISLDYYNYVTVLVKIWHSMQKLSMGLNH